MKINLNYEAMRNGLFLLLMVALFSCHRSLVQIPTNTEYSIVSIEPQVPAETIMVSASASEAFASGEEYISRFSKIKTSSKVEINANQQEARVPELSRKALLKIIKDEKKESRKVKKERDPRYTNALVMTIFGGLGTIFGVALFTIAPTGLLIFACGLVFLVGFVSLLLYWANPKPKL